MFRIEIYLDFFYYKSILKINSSYDEAVDKSKTK